VKEILKYVREKADLHCSSMKKMSSAKPKRKNEKDIGVNWRREKAACQEKK